MPSTAGMIARALLPTLACGLIAGCGGSAHGEGTPNPKTTARAYAAEVNLRASDLPEMTIDAPAGEVAVSSSADAYARCDGEANPELRIAKLNSPEFTAGRARTTQFVSSAVEVLPNPAVAAHNLAAYTSHRGRSCFVRFLTAAYREQHTGWFRHERPTIALLPNPLPGVPGSFAWRITSRISGVNSRGVRVSFPTYDDLFGFLHGAAETILNAVGWSNPVPADRERRLLLLLHRRALTHTP